MLVIPRRITGITHPQIREMYIKKELRQKKYEDVLVIETREKSFKGSQFYELLSDLKDLKKKIEQRIGAFDRIDIRSPQISM